MPIKPENKHRHPKRKATYRTPAAAQDAVITHAQDMLFGHCRNGGAYVCR